MKTPQHTLLILFLVFINCGYLSAQQPDEIIVIDNPDADTVFYCGSPVAVAPGIVIDDFGTEIPIDGIKISITNYMPEEDFLFYTGNAFTSEWDAGVGNLEIIGPGTAEELQEAVQNVFYESTSGTQANEFRSISISLLDADFLPETGHFYQYVPQANITWYEAREAAAGISYFGLEGYLATITSPVENDFIWSKIDGIGWIGATDEEVEGTWKWVTGPEGLDGGTVFWQGDASGQPVDSLFANWSRGEPNDNFGEDYAHINLDPNKADKTWNDLPNAGGGGVYTSQGYIVEFGGMPGEPKLKLSASAVIGVNQLPEKPSVDFEALICGEKRQQLQIVVGEGISSLLYPLDQNATVSQESSLAPVIEVQEFGRYRFVLQTFNNMQCSTFDTLLISFRHQPVAQLNIAEAVCVDYNLQLSFEGEAEGDALYEWYSNDTLYVAGPDLASVNIPLGEGISNRTVGLKVSEGGCIDSIKIPVTVKPTVEIVADPLDGCTPVDVKFSYTSSEQAVNQSWNIGPGNTSVEENPSVTFENEGAGVISYDVALQVMSAEGCVSGDTAESMIRVHPLPTVDLNFDESVCYNGNEEIRYIGNAGPRDTFIWDLSGIPPGDVVQDPNFTAGPLQLNLTGNPVADIGLHVISEFGCKSDTIVKTYKQKPVIDVTTDTLGGCPPFEVKLSVSADGLTGQVNYLWDFGNGQTAGGSSVGTVYSEENQHYDVTVHGVSSVSGCADTLFLPGKIFAYPVPEASFTADPVSVPVTDPEITFNNTSAGATGYEWDFGDDSFGSTAENPVYRYENLGLFDVTLMAVNEFECTDTSSIRVSVTFDKLYPPNAFSPNAENDEDKEFRIYAEGIVNDGYKLLIFNRWGEVIFTSVSPDEGWDGTMKNGSNAPSGTYFWVLEYRDLLGEEHSQKGSLTLLY